MIARYVIKRQTFPIAKPRESSAALPNKNNVKNVAQNSPTVSKKNCVRNFI
jgi:hypothetical protein